MNFKIEKYKKDGEYSFAFGAFPCFELVKQKPNQVVCLIISSKLKQTDDIRELISRCKDKNITVEENDKLIQKISDKENCFVVGVFKKYSCTKQAGNNLVLVNPSDMGNMGTIMRTALGFDIKNLAIIKPAVDVFNPKVVRASMGAIFSLNIVEYDSVQDYLTSSNNKKFFFMLDGENELGSFVPPKQFDLVFGNEATGLPDYLLHQDTSVVIRHSKNIDSLNLPISVGMAIYEFCKNR